LSPRATLRSCRSGLANRKNNDGVEYDVRIVVVDTGLMFRAPTSSASISSCLTSPTCWSGRRTSEAIVLTHGHEGHVGAALPAASVWPFAGDLRRAAHRRDGPIEAR